MRLPAEPALVLDDLGAAGELVDQLVALIALEAHDVVDEEAIDIEQLAAGLGMGANHGVLDGRVLGAHLRLLVRGDHDAEDLGVVVHGDEVVDRVPGRLVESFVGGVHVAEQGVAAARRDVHRAEDGTHRRGLPPRHVAVPAVLVTTDLG